MGRLKSGVFSERCKIAAAIINSSKGPVTSKSLAEKMGITTESAKNIILRLATSGYFEAAEAHGFCIWRRHNELE